MKNNKTDEQKIHKNKDKGTVFVKIMAGFLAILMIVATSASFIYALING